MWTRRWFEQQGFGGWKRFDELELGDLPKAKGVYVVLTEPSDARPNFLKYNVGGFHKGKPLTDDPAKVAENWLLGAEVLYLGMVGSTREFHARLWAYVKQGRGLSAGHRGGRYLWQLPRSESLTVAWRPTGDLKPHDVEDALLSLFRADSGGDRPFANLKDGTRFTPEQARELLNGWLVEP